MILGKNLIMTLGDNNRGLAASKSCNLSIDTDFIEVCSPVEGSWKEYLPTIKSWSASIDTLVASLSDHKALVAKQDNNEKLICCFFDTDLQEYYKGHCYIKNVQIKGTEGSLAKMGVILQPTGKLEWADQETLSIDLASAYPRTLGLPVGTNTVTVMDRAAGDPQLIAWEVMVTNETRFTIKRAAIINQPLSVVEGWIMSKDNSNIQASAIAVETSYVNKDVIVKPNGGLRVTILQNDNNATLYPITYLSKF